MKNIYDDLIQFSSYAEPIDFSFNQYLLISDQPILVHTGNTETAKKIIEPITETLNGKPLCFIFVSHFESDECGGLEVILDAFPEARVLCSEVTSRQLKGFGLPGDTLPQKGGDTIIAPDDELEFITYPSEMHLWDGLLLFERKRKVLFSSDLVFRHGNTGGSVIEKNISEELESITPEQIPDAEKRALLIESLKRKGINFIATGHGPCVKGAAK